MIGLAAMCALVKSPLDTQQLTNGALRFAQLDAGLQLDAGIIERPPQVLDAGMTCLEPGDVYGDPFANVVNAHLDQSIQMRC